MILLLTINIGSYGSPLCKPYWPLLFILINGKNKIRNKQERVPHPTRAHRIIAKYSLWSLNSPLPALVEVIMRRWEKSKSNVHTHAQNVALYPFKSDENYIWRYMEVRLEARAQSSHLLITSKNNRTEQPSTS